MNKLIKNEIGEQPKRRGLARTAAGVLTVALSLTATVVAAPPQKHDSPEILGHVAKLNLKLHWFQIGKASWYGTKFQGHRTADGEKFDMHALTCAHRTLPMGSWLRVTNLKNGKSTFVRVNDRGPVPETRIVDLSYAAAQQLGIHGVTKVRLEQIKSDDPALLAEMVDQVNLPLIKEPSTVGQ